MKFLIDAQLPRLLAIRLNELGHEARHTLGLAKGNQTPDREISSLADRDSTVVITKDADFVDSHVLAGKLAKPCSFRPTTSRIKNSSVCSKPILIASSQPWRHPTSLKSPHPVWFFTIDSIALGSEWTFRIKAPGRMQQPCEPGRTSFPGVNTPPHLLRLLS